MQEGAPPPPQSATGHHRRRQAQTCARSACSPAIPSRASHQQCADSIVAKDRHSRRLADPRGVRDVSADLFRPGAPSALAQPGLLLDERFPSQSSRLARFRRAE